VVGSAVFFNSMERVEVLKGPQGTLFGRNTTGGVINIVTKDPQPETALKLGASYGNYDTAEFSLYGTTGLTDNLAADVAVYLGNQGEGYSDMYWQDPPNRQQNTDDNKREDEHNYRTKWKYSGDTFEATLIGSYNEFSDDMGYVRGAPPGVINIDGHTQPGDEWDVYADTQAYADAEGKVLSLSSELRRHRYRQHPA
jgi:iron complex outermembrane receptor protein